MGEAVSAAQSSQALRALLVEDNADDVGLTLDALARSGFAVTHEVVETDVALESALSGREWDVVLSDYHLPTLNGSHALAAVRKLAGDTPFILVSGTIGEDLAAEVMRGGANDYILKDKLQRLGAAVAREVRSAEDRRRQREAEAALHRTEELNRVLLASSTDWVSILDEDGVTRFVSPPVERTLGYRPEELIGMRDHPLVVDEDRPALQTAMAHLVANPSASVTVQARVLHKDGSTREIESTLQNFLHDPMIRGLIASTRDISQRQAIEAERRARVVAEMASRTKSSFLANMSHELRTPLNAIIGFSELLEQGLAGPLSAKQSTYVDNVLQSGRHLLSLVNDILDLSKVEAGKLTLAREWTSLASIGRSISETVAPLLQSSGVTLEVGAPETLPLVYVDPIRLKQILFNLVSNGIKFNRRGGRVRLGVVPVGRGVEISVEDTGIGIEAENFPRLFREFERLSETGVDGTGLGLALTRRLVELHGGRITASSTPGSGATFTVAFPDVQRPRRSSEPPSAHLRQRNVLVVEPDPHACALLAQHLRSAGLHPLFARDAEEALTMAGQERPALITLSTELPAIDGWAALECLKQDPETGAIPVVVISIDDDRRRSLALGAAAHLVKPVGRDAVHDVLRSVGIVPKSVAGRRVLVVGHGDDLDRVADGLVEAGAKVERRPSIAAGEAVRCDVAVVEAAEAAALAARPHPPPILTIVDRGHPAGDVAFIERSDLRTPEVVCRVLESMIPLRGEEDA